MEWDLVLKVVYSLHPQTARTWHVYLVNQWIESNYAISLWLLFTYLHAAGLNYDNIWIYLWKSEGGCRWWEDASLHVVSQHTRIKRGEEELLDNGSSGVLIKIDWWIDFHSLNMSHLNFKIKKYKKKVEDEENFFFSRRNYSFIFFISWKMSGKFSSTTSVAWLNDFFHNISDGKFFRNVTWVSNKIIILFCIQVQEFSVVHGNRLKVTRTT